MPLTLGHTNVQHIAYNILFRTDSPRPGILVRNDTAKEKLGQRLRGSIIMSGLKFFRRLFT